MVRVIITRVLFCSFVYKVLASLRKNEWGLEAGHGVIDFMTSTLVFLTNGTGTSTAFHVDWTPACNGGVLVIRGGIETVEIQVGIKLCS